MGTEIQFREGRQEDLPALREIALRSFGDTKEQADAYLNDPEGIGIRPLAAEKDGRVVSSFFLLPGIRLETAAGRSYSCTYLYALGTLPEARGEGIGMALYRHAASLAGEEAACVSIVILEEKLKEAYNRRAPIVPLGRMREAVFTAGQLPEGEILLQRIPPEEYARERERWLAGTDHAVYPPVFFRLAARGGTAFYRGEGMLAMAESRGEQCTVYEMLTEKDSYLRAAAAVAKTCPARQHVIRIPAFAAGEGRLRTIAMRLNAGSVPAGCDFWYPLTLE